MTLDVDTQFDRIMDVLRPFEGQVITTEMKQRVVEDLKSVLMEDAPRGTEEGTQWWGNYDDLARANRRNADEPYRGMVDCPVCQKMVPYKYFFVNYLSVVSLAACGHGMFLQLCDWDEGQQSYEDNAPCWWWANDASRSPVSVDIPQLDEGHIDGEWIRDELTQVSLDEMPHDATQDGVHRLMGALDRLRLEEEE